MLFWEHGLRVLPLLFLFGSNVSSEGLLWGSLMFSKSTYMTWDLGQLASQSGEMYVI